MNNIEKANSAVQELERKLALKEAEEAEIRRQLEAAKANAKQVSEQREAIEKIDKYLATAKQALIDASEVAREAGIEFHFRYAKWRTTDFQRSLAVV